MLHSCKQMGEFLAIFKFQVIVLNEVIAIIITIYIQLTNYV